MKQFSWIVSLILLLSILLSGCVQPAPNSRPWLMHVETEVPEIETSESVIATEIPVVKLNNPLQSPTPDIPHNIPTLRPNEEFYTVQYGDYMAAIAYKYNVDLGVLISANPGIDPNWLEVGQVVTIPAMKSNIAPSSFKIIPDSELVYGPSANSLNIGDFLRKHNSFLLTYTDEVDDQQLSGTQIIKRVSLEYSINPRLLLTLLEYKTGWVTSKIAGSTSLDYPLGKEDPYQKGLYKQLAWFASQVNRGYYLWKVDAISFVNLAEGGLAPLDPTLNAGTVGVQYAMGIDQSSTVWKKAVSETGVYQIFTNFFGNPFSFSFEPLIPADLKQPKMSLPFESGVPWAFTGGPHAGWDEGSAWAALDFAPPADQFGCYTSDAWVTAVSEGVIARTGDGAVILDLDSDGNEGTGWVVLYMHIESRDRIAVGTKVNIGDRIGHASCEGGYSNGTHLHLARRYNGEWISADTNLPFNLSGWKSTGVGIEYDGTLTKKGQIVYSVEGRVPANEIQK